MKKTIEPYCCPHCGKPPIITWIIKSICFIENMIINTMSFFYVLWKNIFGKEDTPPIKSIRPKVAIISVYGISCGIATYNEELVEELSKYADIRFFAEYADEQRTERLSTDPEFIVRCWSRYSHPKTKLLRLIREWNPDIVHISHEYGFFAKAYQFTSLVSLLKMCNFKVVSTMHSVYEHLDKSVSEACVPNLIVHTKEAKDCLISKGIKSNIFVIPHGLKILAGTSKNPELLEPLWNTWQSDHTIFQPGFLFDYKGHDRIIKMLPKLKLKYPDVHYIIQGSENPHTALEHESVYRRLLKLAEKLDVLDNITINRGFVGKELLLSYIRTVKCCVLPYDIHPQHNVRSSSGIAKLIMNTTTPLITSDVHFFDDLDDVAFRCSSDREIYNSIDAVFRGDKVVEKQILARKEFIKENSWVSVAKKTYDTYLEIIGK
jgi:glycosyltransferase involved in cell wall biosynthesis